jgi:hypothetical protein
MYVFHCLSPSFAGNKIFSFNHKKLFVKYLWKARVVFMIMGALLANLKDHENYF